MEGFRRRLTDLRENLDLTQTEVSRKLYLSKNTFGQYERGDRTPDLEKLLKIADFFDVSIEYLLFGIEYSNNGIMHPTIQVLEKLYKEKTGKDNLAITKVENWSSLSTDQLMELSNLFDWIQVREQFNKENK